MSVFRPQIHREKRKYLRTALKELGIVFTDQPGLLGPKVLPTILPLLRILKDCVYGLGKNNVESLVLQPA